MHSKQAHHHHDDDVVNDDFVDGNGDGGSSNVPTL
jgi:hypothetical protein